MPVDMGSYCTVNNAWYALHTKPKQEWRAAKNLAAWNIEIFMPRIASYKLPHREEILFPGYIFACLNIYELLRKVSFTRGVAHVVSFGGKPAVVCDDVIEAIRSHTNQYGIASISLSFKKGDAVIVRSGALESLVGIFERETPDRERVQILLTTLAYTARVEIAKSAVSAFTEEDRAKLDEGC
jgi:transcriptional antiterminator RfaH